MLLCHTGLALSSSVAGFWRFFIIRFLSPSFVVRFLHLQFVCCFRFVGRFPMCLVQDTGLYLFCQFHAQFRFMLARFKFHFSFCGCPFFSSSSGMVTTTQGMFSLLPIGRHLCSFARIFGYRPRCFGLQRRQQNCRCAFTKLTVEEFQRTRSTTATEPRIRTAVVAV